MGETSLSTHKHSLAESEVRVEGELRPHSCILEHWQQLRRKIAAMHTCEAGEPLADESSRQKRGEKSEKRLPRGDGKMIYAVTGTFGTPKANSIRMLEARTV